MTTCLSDPEFVALLHLWRDAERFPLALYERLAMEAEKRGYHGPLAAWRDRALRARGGRVVYGDFVRRDGLRMDSYIEIPGIDGGRAMQGEADA